MLLFGVIHVTAIFEVENLWPSRTVVCNCRPPDVLGLQLPEAFIATSAGQDFWELKSKNIWRPKIGDYCSRILLYSLQSPALDLLDGPKKPNG